MVTRDAIRALLGRRVTLQLVSSGGFGERVRGKLVGTIDAADGMVVTLEPDDRPGGRGPRVGQGPQTRLTIHYHLIVAAKPA